MHACRFSRLNRAAGYRLAVLPFASYESGADVPEHVGLMLADTLLTELLIEGTVTSPAGQGWQAELRLLAVPPGRVAFSTAVSGDAGTPLDVRAVSAAMADDLVDAWPALRSRLGDED